MEDIKKNQMEFLKMKNIISKKIQVLLSGPLPLWELCTLTQ